MRLLKSLSSLVRLSSIIGGVALMALATNAVSAQSSAGAKAADGMPALSWTINTNTFLESAPSLADVNGDGTQEVVLAGREELIVLNGQGKELWRWKAKGRFMTYPSALERTGQPALLYAADASGYMYCVDGAGKPVWEAKMNGGSAWSASGVADLSGLGKPCVVQTDEKGTVWAFDAVSGQVLWQTAVNGIPVSPAIADVDDDGKSEIAVATGAGRLVLLSADGSIRWDIKIGGPSLSWATSAPIMFAASTGDVRVLAAGSAGDVTCLDRNGNVLWQYATHAPIASGLSAGRSDKGEARLFAATQMGSIYQFSESGEVLWNIDMQGRCLAAGALADINGDNALEYVISTQTGNLFALDGKGAFLFSYQFDCRTINMTPAIGNILSDGAGLEMVINGGETGKVFCYSLPNAAKGPMPWTQYRADAAKTGAWLGLKQSGEMQIRAENLSAKDLLPGAVLRFSALNPKAGGQPVKATVTRKGPGDETQTVTTVMVGKRTALEMPLSTVREGAVEFSFEMKSEDGKVLYTETKQLAVNAFASARELVKSAIETAETAAADLEKSLPNGAVALRREVVLLHAEAAAVPPLREVANGAAAVAPASSDVTPAAAVVARAKRLTELTTLARQAAALGATTSLAAFEAGTWENRNVETQMPERVSATVKASRRMVPGEHEPVSFGLLNLTDREVVARVYIKHADGAPVVTPHRSIGIPCSLGETSWDPLPPLDNTGTLVIPSFGVRELWLDIDAADCKPGAYPVDIVVKALNGAGVMEAGTNPQSVSAPETAIKLDVNVLPFEMAPSGSCRLCSWASYSPSAMADLLEHGNNVFVAPISEPQYDAQGVLTGFSHAKLDAYIGPLVGKDVMVLPQGIPAIRGDKKSPEYAASFAKFVEDMTSYLGGKGFDTEHFAFYPVDEPGGAGWAAVNEVVEFGKLVKAANPKVKVYIDGGGEKPMFEAMKPYVDIWTPGISQLPEKSPEMDIMRSVGQLWSYNCSYAYTRPIGMNIKNVNLVAEFRWAAPFVFRHGATGLGFWCYNIGTDIWPRNEMEYPLVYPGADSPVTSRRWEAVREGVEDYRIMAALRAKLAADSGASENARARIKHLLDVSLPAAMDQSYEEMRRGLARSVLDATNNDGAVNALRQETLDCIEALR